MAMALEKTLFFTFFSSLKEKAFSCSLLDTALLCTVSKEALQTKTVTSTIGSSALSLHGLAKLASGTYQLIEFSCKGSVLLFCCKIRHSTLARAVPVPDCTRLASVPSSSADLGFGGR